MEASTVLPWLGIAIAFGSFALGVYKIRHDDKKEIEHRFIQQERSLSDFKLEVAQTHPTAEELGNAVASLKASLDRLTDRIDRFLDRN